jgi:hypothetical protein
VTGWRAARRAVPQAVGHVEHRTLSGAGPHGSEA